MTPGFGLIPSDVSTNTAITIGAIALISGTARGFSGFGSALIFMPLASSLAAPRLVAAVLLIIDFVAAVPLIPNAWRQADRSATAVMVSGALIGVPLGTYFLSRLDPVTTRWIISGFVFALFVLLISGWRYRGKDHRDFRGHRRTVWLLQRSRPDRRPADRRLLARPSCRLRDCPREYPDIFWRFRFLFRRELCVRRARHRRRHSVLAFGRSGLWHRGLVRRILVRTRQRKTLSLDLLCVDCGGRRDRLAGAGSFAALENLAPTCLCHLQVAVSVAIALDTLAGNKRQCTGKNRPRNYAGMKFAVFATGIDALRQIGKQP
jgi:sulfite exporter TauE/SafE